MDSTLPRLLIADDLVLDRADARAFLSGQPIAMSPKCFALLEALMAAPQTLVTKDEIFAEVWPDIFVGDAALTTAIKELRKALDDSAKAQEWVQTVHGKGYRFRKAVEFGDHPKPADAKVSEVVPQELSIAVLAFSDMSPDNDQSYFSDGISEEILNALVKVPGLHVAGRTSSFAYRGRNIDIREIGRDLSVSHVLEGSVRKHGDQIRITAQLIQSSNGFHLWSETYNGGLSDVFDLQEDIAKKIAAELQIVFGAETHGRFAKALTENAEAHDLYLRGKSLVDVRAGDTTLTQAVKLLERSAELDTGFAEAWAELARAYNALPQYTLVKDSNIYLDRAANAAQKALALDPTLARAHLSASGIDSRKYGLTLPYHRLTKAVELDPRDADALGALSYYWCIIGHTRKAVEVGEAALELSPLNATNCWILGLAQINAGNLDRARCLLEQSLGLGFLPAAMVLPHVFALSGDRAKARDWLSRAFSTMNPEFHQLTGISDFSTLLADAVHTEKKQSRGDLRAALRTYARQSSAIFNTQILSVIMNIADYETFFRVYQAQTFSGDTYILCTLWDRGPAATGLRTHTAFKGFTQSIGLDTAWREHGAPDIIT